MGKRKENSLEMENLTCYWDKVNILTFQSMSVLKTVQYMLPVFLADGFCLSESGRSMPAEHLRHGEVAGAPHSNWPSGGWKG